MLTLQEEIILLGGSPTIPVTLIVRVVCVPVVDLSLWFCWSMSSKRASSIDAYSFELKCWGGRKLFLGD